jgi:phosphohistidine phosphatase SixA
MVHDRGQTPALPSPRRKLAALALSLVLVLVAVGCGDRGGGTTNGTTGAALEGERLVAELRDGGYVIFFRHTATDWSPDDQHPVDFSDCDTQRNLSDEGRDQARAIGEAFETLGIPVGRVLSSPFCRAIDTARLAFGTATPEAVIENLETSEDDAERDWRSDGLRNLLSTPPDAGTNTVLTSHGYNVEAVADVSTAEGEGYVFRPDPTEGYALVATLTPAHWGELTAELNVDR